MYGQGTGKVWLENVHCKGNELKLTDCPHGGWGKTGCSHARDAGVKCLQEGNIYLYFDCFPCCGWSRNDTTYSIYLSYFHYLDNL